MRQSASEGILSREQFLDALRFEDLDKPSTKVGPAIGAIVQGALSRRGGNAIDEVVQVVLEQPFQHVHWRDLRG